MEEAEKITENLEKLPAIGEYVLRSKLGESSLSTVWQAEHRTTGEVVALKQIYIRKLTRCLKNCLECELTFLSSVNHPNIIRLLDVLEVEGYIILVLEFCAGGNLAFYIRRHGRVQECTAKRFMQQLGAGLKILKSHNIIHRDLKPENILLSSCECDPVLKIADFGLSRILRPDEFAETVCGSPMYMAPEVLQFQKYDEKVDMWSVGAIFFELLNGYPPFRGRTSVQLLQNIKASTSLPFSQLILPQLHPDSVDLCSRLLSTNPDNRLSIEEFYQHNFLRNGKWTHHQQ
ncbi:protein kinase family protein [Forsythia ovata]|uniref:Protein kinase family protein n=1 Tax=Forsythia ovata TaxID=205694 RepID=A0ABD1WS46_9LAMI